MECEEIMAEKFPNLKKETEIQEVQDTQRAPNKMNPNRCTSGHIIQMVKVKDKKRILKAERGKQSYSREPP